MMANIEASLFKGDNNWALMLDPDGFIAEGPGWNIFLVKDGVLYTSEPRNCLLGVSRGVALQLAAQLGIPLRETNLGRYEALCADEIFCTASSFCLVHAIAFEDQELSPSPGPVYQRLLEAWKQYVGIDFVQQAKDYHAALEAWKTR